MHGHRNLKRVRVSNKLPNPTQQFPPQEATSCSDGKKNFIVLTSCKTAPHNSYQPHPVEPEQYTKCTNTRSLISWRWAYWRPKHAETEVNNKHLIVASCWFLYLQKSVCLTVIHDIIPTKERLVKIWLRDTRHGNLCGIHDTLQHPTTEFRERADIWLWTRTRIAQILGKDTGYITPDWTIRPQFNLCPPSGRGPSYGYSHIWHIAAYNTETDPLQLTMWTIWGALAGKA
jgi:hypothetical protein